jgi:hypothetical protein
MDNGKRLYDQLSKEKLYTKSYNEFVGQFGSDDGQKRLYNALKEQNLYTKSEQEFVGQYWGQVKKKDQTQDMGSVGLSKTAKSSSVSQGQIVTGPSASFGQLGSKLLAQEPTPQELPSTEGELLRAPEKPKPYNLTDKSWLENKQDINVLSKDVINQSKIVASSIKSFNNDSKLFQDDITSFQELAKNNPSDPQLITLQQDLQKRQEELNQRSQALNNQASQVDVAQIELKKKALANYKKKAEQGNWGGALWNSIINGLESSGQGMQRAAIDSGIELLDFMGIPYASKEKQSELRNKVLSESKGKLTEEEVNAKVKDLSKKEVISTFKPILEKGYEGVKSKGTTEEYIQEKKKEGIIPLAALGVTESLPAMLSGKGYGQFVVGAMQTYANLNEQMDNDPTLAGMDENERKKITLPISIISGYLEETSWGKTLKREAPALKPIVNKLVSTILSKIPKNATLNVIEKTVKDFAESTAGKLLLKTGEDAARAYGNEAETGALQSASEMLIKEIYDKANNVDLFKNPELLSKEFLKKIAYDANVEGIGGLIIGGPMMAVQSAFQGKDLSNDDFVAMKSLIQDPENARLTISKITSDLSSGAITKEDADSQLKALNESKRILDLIPDQIPVESQRKAFGILADNAKIQTELEQMSKDIVGKDPNLVTDVTASMKEKEAQIEKNNQELSKLPKNAVQEQTTSEVPVQPEAGTSLQVAEGEPQAEPQVPTEESQGQEVENKPITVGDKVLDSNGVEYEVIALTTSRKGTQQAELKIPKKNDAEINEDARRNVFNRNQNRSFYKDYNDPEFIKDNAIAIAQEISELTEANNNTQSSLTLNLSDLKLSAQQTPNQQTTTEEVNPTEEVKVEEVKPTEMSQEEWTKVQDLADRISNGEEITSAEDLQIQQNYPQTIESLLAKKVKPVEEQAPEVKSTLSDNQKNAISEGIKKAEDLVKAFPKRQPLAVKEKAVAEFQKTNQEYIDANQSQKDEMARQINYALKIIKKKSAPSAKKILGINPEMITVDVMKSLKDQLILQEKAAKGGVEFANQAKKIVNATIKGLKKGALDAKATNDLLTALDAKAETPEQRRDIINKVISIFKKSEGKIAVDEVKAIKDQIKLEARAAKSGADFVKRITKSVGETLKSMVSRGSITPSQQSSIFSGLKSNLVNPVILERFLKKVDKIIEKADYAKDLSDANKLRTRIGKIATREGLGDPVKNIAKGFTKVDPNMVDNITEYIEKAKAFIESVAAPKIVEGKTVEPKAINYQEFNSYLDKEALAQQELANEAEQARFNKLVDEGKISGDMSLEEMREYVKNNPTSLNEGAFDYPKSVQVMKDSKVFFEDYKKEILEMIKNGEVSKEDLPLIKDFLNINVLRLTSTEAFKAATSLNNFIVNGSTENMGAILKNYIGALNSAKTLKDLEYKKRTVEKKIKVGGYKKYIYGLLGNWVHYGAKYISKKKIAKLSDIYQEAWLRELSHLDNFGNTYFGIKPWENMKEAMGYNQIEEGAVDTKHIVTDFAKKIEDKYKNKKNGSHNFLTTYTSNELGIIGVLYRESADRDTQEYFNERKKNITETLKYLESTEGREKDAEIWRDIYDKLDIKNATNGKQVFDKASPVVKDALNDFISEYKKWFPEFSRIAKEQFGIILSQDANYLPDFWENTVDYDPNSDIFSQKGFTAKQDILKTKKAGNFIKPVYPNGLPLNTDGSVAKIVNVDFFQNNIRALTSTIGNVKTAPGINQYLGFIKSPEFKYIIKDKYSRDLFIDKMNYTIRSLTNDVQTPKSHFIWNFIASIYKYFGKMGARLGLSSVFAAGTQTLPLAMNTLTYLNGNPEELYNAMRIINNPEVEQWMNNMPYTTGVRDKQSVTSIEFASQLLAKGDYSNAEKILKTLKDGENIYIDKGLVSGDVYIARASWLAIYLNELKKLGVKDFNFQGYDNPESIKAAREAERIIKKEHNQSMAELLPRLYSGKDSERVALRMGLGPFSGYSMAMKDKIKANAAILFDTNFKSTQEEKAQAAKSLIATLHEQAWFNWIKYGIGVGIIAAANAIDDEDEDELSKLLRELNAKQRAGVNMVQSFTGSLPFVEEQAEQYAMNATLDLIDFFKGLFTEKEGGKMTPEQEAAWKKFESGGEEAMPETYQEKERKKTQEKLDKPFRVYIAEADSRLDAAMDLIGGTTGVAYETMKKIIFDNLYELWEGGFKDKNDKLHEYNEEDKKKIWNRIYRAPLEIKYYPTEFRSIENRRKKNLQKNVLKREAYDKQMEAEFNKQR